MKLRKISLLVLLIGLCTALAVAAAVHKVSQKGRLFSTTRLTIQVGDKVVFTNDDDVVHNVFCMSEGFTFNLKQQLPHASASVVFPKEGTFEVRCAIHPKMKMMVTVQK